jgi:hypothetical protein
MNPEALHAIRAQLDARLADPGMMNAQRYAEFIAAQRRLGLMHGGRPLCRHLRPYLMSRNDLDELTRASELILAALARVAEYALHDSELALELGLSAEERALVAIDPGYPQALVVGRLDAVPSADGVQFVELNADSPAGMVDQLLVERTLFALPHLHQLRGVSPPAPQVALLESLLRAYAAWSGNRRPSTIAIVDWAAVDTGDETRVLEDLFVQAGYPTRRLTPDELVFDGRVLSAHGTRIDLVYRRVIAHELIERRGFDHPLLAAYRSRAVCVANSFRTKLLNKKAGFAVLSDPRFSDLFSREQRRAIAAHVPWTGKCDWHGRSADLLELIATEREQMVLKPNDDYGGRGVLLGWRTSAESWGARLRSAPSTPVIVQERVEPITMRVPTFDGEVVEEEVFFDLCPFVFSGRVGGVMTRFSASPLTNVSAGGCVGSLRVVDTDRDTRVAQAQRRFALLDQRGARP